MMDTTRRWGGCGPLWRRGLWAAGAAVVPWELRSWWHSWAASAVPRRYPQDTFYYIIGIAAAVTWFRRGSRDGFVGKGHARKASE